jgi:hypothetical protein
VYSALREAHDEDWFRNPRTGETLAALLDAMRTRGALGAFARERTEALPAVDPLDPEPLARRAIDALRAARR